MADHGLPALHVLFAWWFSTGAILFLDGLPGWTFRWTMVAATAMLGLGLWGAAASASEATVTGAYLGFTCGLLVWAWIEVSFYTGVVTGPRRHACAHGCSGWGHFRHALQASLHHEIAILVAGAALAAVTWGDPNKMALWTYLLLAVMHQSARLNVFLGVRNVTEEFLPPHLGYLRSFIARRDMNPLFPFSVTAGTFATIAFAAAAFSETADPFEATAFTFLATLSLIALAEHWFLVLPFNVGALWSWSLRGREPAPVPVVEARRIEPHADLAEAPLVAPKRAGGARA
jgi:putative photosynthetic complex assembly protein 2